MGLVIHQAIKNTIITYVGFLIGAINVLFLFTKFVEPDYYGLIALIISTSNILMPVMAFGVQNTLVKFYSSFKTKTSQDGFLTLMLFLPLLVILPLVFFGFLTYDFIGDWLSKKNAIVKNYVWLIFISAVSFAYFEVFYAWSKVQLKSVFGNFMKEVFHRVGTTLLLVALYCNWITVQQLIYSLIGVYVLRMIIMKCYAYSLRFPVLKWQPPTNINAILKYTLLIIIAGSIANVILEIDKFMINQYIAIENVAFYGVAIYIATVISVPLRAMHQITNPLTAKLLNEKKSEDLKVLYKKTSLNLLIISGFVFLIVLLNVNQLYYLIPEQYAGGVLIVFLIGFIKLYDAFLGNTNSILFNSDYYRAVLVLGVFLVVSTVLLNMVFIPKFGIIGAAYATCIAVILYNTLKVLFVYKKFRILPLSSKSGVVFCYILVLTLAFYFWDFQWHPILNIALKSMIISVLYGVVVYYFNFSEDITALMNKLLKKK